jgi:hypothetical protein
MSPEETTMYPTIHYQIAQARIADLHHQAQRDALARAARRARRAQTHQARHSVPALPALAARRLLTALGARHP